jgi:hypothetical protein
MFNAERRYGRLELDGEVKISTLREIDERD